MIAIDLSEDDAKVIALVGGREHVLKSRVFSTLCIGLKHYRRVPSWRKARYMRFFERRFLRLRGFIDVARVVLDPNKVSRILRDVKPGLVVADNKLLRVVTYEPKIPENTPKPRYLENLMTIADNLANYFRLVLRNNPKRFKEELRRFEK